MKPVDLTKLTIPRLKAYRKSVLDKIVPYEICWCGSSLCNQEIGYNRSNPKYLFLLEERTRVNKELGTKQREVSRKDKAKRWANVPTIKELTSRCKKV
jgi:hypothetical protein